MYFVNVYICLHIILTLLLGETFEIGNNEIIPLFDPPHLIKGIRNNLLTKDLAMKVTNNIAEEIASWDIIKTAWIMDKTLHVTRSHLKKITAEHIMENKIKKMRVKHAVQILSGTMASVIETFARTKCEYTYTYTFHLQKVIKK